jgi:rhodanese-related sulfurtransferase
MTTRKLCLPGLGICVALGIIGVGRIPASTQTKSDQPKAPDIETITAEELKAKVVKKEPVTIIDVRASDAYVSSENKIEGAIFVRFRRLKTRLAQPPLKDVPRDREIVTYCACPNEETSIRAAQLFLEAGFQRVRVLKGGWQAWLKANGGMESRPKGP